MKHYKMKRRN